MEHVLLKDKRKISKVELCEKLMSGQLDMNERLLLARVLKDFCKYGEDTIERIQYAGDIYIDLIEKENI